jgi:hypothetical protein
MSAVDTPPDEPLDWRPRDVPLYGPPAAPVGYLSPPVPPRPRRTGLYIAGGALALILLAAGGITAATVLRSHGQPAASASPSPSAAAAPAASPQPVDTLDFATDHICAMNDSLGGDGNTTIMDQGAEIQQIASLGAQAEVFDVHLHALMLGDLYHVAVASKGTDHEISSALEVFGEHLKLETACIQAGWHA